LLHRGVQTLVLLFAVTQMATPLLHVHFGDGSAGPAGVHLHMVNGDHIRPDDRAARSEIHDREARSISAPVEYFRDEPLRLLDLPAAAGAASIAWDPQRYSHAAHFIPVPATAAQPFPKPPPLAPPASA
jgi:hypothetical protein